jgi:hypothetical protein
MVLQACRVCDWVDETREDMYPMATDPRDATQEPHTMGLAAKAPQQKKPRPKIC